jgi:hypothetical protein
VLRNEAVWLRQALEAIPTAELSPLLSIGSGPAASRSRQPWIDELVFGPLDRRGVSVLHHEHAAADGVDVAGDLADPAFLDGIGALGARSLLCANVLEHLERPSTAAAALSRAVTPSGHLFVTVPRRYPYHPDPIDTMLRPSVEDLVAMFPDLRLEAGGEVECGTLFSYAWSVRGKRRIIANGLKAAVHRRDPAAIRTARARPAASKGAGRYLLAQTAVTCAVFARPG